MAERNSLNYLYICSVIIITIFMYVGYQTAKRLATASQDNTPITITEYLPSSDTTFVPLVEYKTEYADRIVYQIKYRDRIIEVPIPVDSAGIIADYLTIKQFTLDTTANEVHSSLDIAVYANRVLTYDLTLLNERKTSNYKNGFVAGGIIGNEEVSLMGGYSFNNYTILGGYDFMGEDAKVVFIYKFNKK